MTALTIILACAAVVAAVVAVVALVALARSRRDAATEAQALRERLDAVESRLREPVRPEPRREPRPEQEYVITRLGELEQAGEDAPVPVPVPVRLTAPAFADAVLRETVVQGAALAHGVRRALAPEVRNRIRFEMRREVKRSRRARKDEVRVALREYRARRRATPPGTEGAA